MRLAGLQLEPQSPPAAGVQLSPVLLHQGGSLVSYHHHSRVNVATRESWDHWRINHKQFVSAMNPVSTITHLLNSTTCPLSLQKAIPWLRELTQQKPMGKTKQTINKNTKIKTVKKTAILKCEKEQPHGKENTEVQITPKIWKERGNSFFPTFWK